MRCRAIFLVPLVCLLVIQDSEGQQSNRDQVLAMTTSRAITSFGLSLYRQLADRDPTGNVVFSPFGVYSALAMTVLGAGGPTKDQLKAMLAPRHQEQIDKGLRAVLASFPSSQNANIEAKVANALYYNDSLFEFADSFVRNLPPHYGIHPKPFELPEPEVPINEWMSRQTNGKIEGFLNPGDITPDMTMILLNAIFFKGKWKFEFEEPYTPELSFYTASGDIVSVPTVYRNDAFSVKCPSEDVPAHVLELPYESDDRYSMFILFPTRPDGMSDLESRLNSQSLEEAVTDMPPATTYFVLMPKFKLRSKTSLKQALEAMGLTRFFVNANFERMVNQSSVPVAIGDVIHEVVVEVDGEGTIPAAVAHFMRIPPPTFGLSRPFMFILRDKKARINLLIGRLNNPAMD